MAEPQAFSPDRVKHLELIQGVVTRLGTSSFLIKGWALTVETAFFAVLANRLSWKISVVAFIPILFFWLLDAYYLRQERLFRRLYNDARQPHSKRDVFDMGVARYQDSERMLAVTLSMTLRYFYGALSMVNFAFFVGAVAHVLT